MCQDCPHTLECDDPGCHNTLPSRRMRRRSNASSGARRHSVAMSDWTARVGARSQRRRVSANVVAAHSCSGGSKLSRLERLARGRVYAFIT